MALAFFQHTADFVTGSLTNSPSQRPLWAVAGASVTLGLALGAIWSTGTSRSPKIIPSPLKAVQSATSIEKGGPSPLPLDVLPGARDVSTPYGSIRVYEWGPEDGQKVLLVHGISTPCVSLGGLAHSLVDRGCRVMTFDLFGRGYSDFPADIPQDNRLFATQIFLVLASSPLSWTGASSGKFSLIGYSLGGGIAAAFASYFHGLLSSLILLAPAGLLRDSHVGWQTHLLNAKGLLPESVVISLVTGRLKSGPLVKPKKSSDTQKELHNQTVGVGAALTQELTESPQVVSRAYPSLKTVESVAWQVENHDGFIPAFISSMRHGPVMQRTQLENWQRLGSFLSQRKLEGDGTGLPHDKVLVILGETDNVIFKEDTVEDINRVLEGNAQITYVSIGHEFPSVEYDGVAAQLIEFWK